MGVLLPYASSLFDEQNLCDRKALEHEERRSDMKFPTDAHAAIGHGLGARMEPVVEYGLPVSATGRTGARITAHPSDEGAMLLRVSPYGSMVTPDPAIVADALLPHWAVPPGVSVALVLSILRHGPHSGSPHAGAPRLNEATIANCAQLHTGPEARSMYVEVVQDDALRFYPLPDANGVYLEPVALGFYGPWYPEAVAGVLGDLRNAVLPAE
jgi:hypothetical protein